MIVDKKREKLIHAMIFFIKKTKHCYMLKLFKLLYFLDFKHFKQTGRSVTGLEYYAWPMGPVPKNLYKEIKDKNPDLFQHLKITPLKNIAPEIQNEKALKFSPKTRLNKEVFSEREIKIMEEIIEIYKDAKADVMTTASHEAGNPWHQVYKKEGSEQGLIPYLYALDDSSESITKEEAIEIQNDNEEMKKNFGG